MNLYSCIMLVVIYNCTTMHGHMNVKWRKCVVHVVLLGLCEEKCLKSFRTRALVNLVHRNLSDL